MTWRRAWPWVVPVLAWLASRVAMAAGFAAGIRSSDPAAVLHVAGERYDAGWYAIIVTSGYTRSGDASHAAAFYPGYPLLVAAVRPVVHDMALAMVLVSNLALLAAAICLYRLYSARWGARVAVLGLGLLLCAPEAIFFGIGFSEAAFLAAVAATFLAAGRGHWLLAGLAGAAACLVRVNGLLLGVPLLLIAWQSGAWRTPLRLVPGAAVFLAGVAAYPAYLGLAFGDPLRYGHLQSTFWHHHLVNPLQPVLAGLYRSVAAAHALLINRSTHVRRVDAAAVFQDGAMLVAAVATLVAGWRRLPWAEWAWVALVLAPPLLVFNVPDSLARYLLAAFPIYFLAARLTARIPAIPVALMLAGLLFQWELSFRLAQGWFVA